MYVRACVQQARLTLGSLCEVSVTHSQLRSKNIKWKIPEINNLHILNCVLFLVWCKLILSSSIPPETWIIPSSEYHWTYTPRPLVAERPPALSVDWRGIIMAVFKSPLFYLTMATKRKSSDPSNSNASQRSHTVLPLDEKVTRVRRDSLRKREQTFA